MREEIKEKRIRMVMNNKVKSKSWEKIGTSRRKGSGV